MSSPKSGLTTFLLSLPPMGIFGFHRFYTGKIGTGVLMMATLGGFGLWTLYDIAQITGNNFKDEYGQRVNFLENGRWPTNAILALGLAFLAYAISPSLLIVNPFTISFATAAFVFAVALLAVSSSRYVYTSPTYIDSNVMPINPIMTGPVVLHRPAPSFTFAPPVVSMGIPHSVVGMSPISRPAPAMGLSFAPSVGHGHGHGSHGGISLSMGHGHGNR